MIRITALILTVVLVLSACAPLKEDEGAEYEQALLMQELDLGQAIVITPLLYFLNQAQTKIQAEAREISVPQDGVREWYVIEELIKGPVSENLVPVADGFELEDMEVMPDLINVYLGQNTWVSEDAVLNTKIAIAATLSDYSGQKNVNVYINGSQAAYRGLPTGVMQKISNDLSEERLVMQSKAETGNPELQAALYYLDSSEGFILPEARRLIFRDNSYVETLVEQLIKGPDDAYNHRPVMDSSIRLISHQTVQTEDGLTVERLVFNKDPFAATSEFTDGGKMALAALTYTIVGFLPGIDGIEVAVGNSASTDGTYTPSMYSDLLGASITIYLPNSASTRLLTGVQRVISQKAAADPNAILETLMKGRTDNDDEQELYPPMPMGVTIEDVDRIYIAHDIMVVDFDEAVDKKLESVSQENEFVMLFSIVNTLTAYEDIKRVQFLLEGERVEYLGGGRINIIDPVLKNPGIIR